MTKPSVDVSHSEEISLEPGAKEATGGAAGGKLACSVDEVPGVDLGGTEVFDDPEGCEL